ncbi:phage tail protein [Paenibacillus lentus]|uniref:phage tail protein n=1 Tax=Paenibacillus lentus TaxID=1338368 RepID=UPI00365C0B00
MEVPPASLTEAGIVQLSNATNSTSEAQAATSKAVKSAYDAAAVAQTTANAANSAAAAAFQLGNERKAEVVAALVAWGISASTSESWDSLLSKMTAIINRGAQVITPGTTNRAIPAGYHNGSGYVVGEPNLIAGNLPKDKSFFGIVGALERMTTAEKQAIAAAITGKGVAASASDTNTVLAQKIGSIQTKTYGVIDINRPGTSETTLNRGEAKFTPLAQLPRGISFFSFRATGTELGSFGPRGSEESGYILRTYVILRNVGGSAYIRLLNFNFYGFTYFCNLISLNYEISSNMVSIVVKNPGNDSVNYFFSTGIAEGTGTVDFAQPLELCFRHYMWIESSSYMFIQTGIVGRLYYA